MPKTVQYYAVIDTNVIVSAMMKKNTPPDEILKMVSSGRIIPLLNYGILAEYAKVLPRPKFHFTQDNIRNNLKLIINHGIFVDTTLDVIVGDPKDRIFYAVVMEKRKDDDAYLVTGNKKHFPIEPFVVSPHEMVEIIASNDDGR